MVDGSLYYLQVLYGLAQAAKMTFFRPASQNHFFHALTFFI